MKNQSVNVPDCEVLLIGEGGDDVRFLAAIAKRAGISGAGSLNLGGRDNLATNLQIVGEKLEDGDSGIRAFAVVLDADNSAASAMAKVNGGIARAFDAGEKFFKRPVEVKPLKFQGRTFAAGIFIMPGGKAKRGALEDLILKAAEENGGAAFDCVREFRACARQAGAASGNESKSAAQALLSVLPEHCVNLGVAAEKSLLDFSSPAYSELKKFLQKLSP